MRLSDDAEPPNEAGWERCLNAINKKLGIPKLSGVAETKRPHHRELCLEICGWGRSYWAEFEEARAASGPKRDSAWYTMVAAHALFRGDTDGAVQVLKRASTEYPELLFVSLALQLIGRSGDNNAKAALDFDERVACKTDPYLRAISSIIATGDWAVIANQRTLPLRDRCFVALRNFDDDALTSWLEREISVVKETGDIEGIILTGITDSLVDILARYVQKFNDFQTATLLLSICAPRFIDDMRATAMRNAYRFYLHRHRAYFLRAKFDVESTKRSKHQGQPTLPPAGRQIGLRCVYCDVQTKLESLQTRPCTGGNVRATGGAAGVRSPVPSFMQPGAAASTPRMEARSRQQANPFTDKMVAAGISCPNCKQHLPRCVVCLEVVGMPRSDRPELSRDPEVRRAARFPTFCVSCGHVLHLDHARQWFARHRECPVPECRCLCNTRINEELDYP